LNLRVVPFTRPAFVSECRAIEAIDRIKERGMVAYVIFIKEKTKKQAEVELYKQMAPAGMAGHPITFRIAHGRKEVVEGPDCEDIMMLEFPTFEEAKAWYSNPAYQAASEHRFKGADYRTIIIEGVSPK
jgi:uncharacterized protein (DUF1330 family)